MCVCGLGGSALGGRGRSFSVDVNTENETKKRVPNSCQNKEKIEFDLAIKKIHDDAQKNVEILEKIVVEMDNFSKNNAYQINCDSFNTVFSKFKKSFVDGKEICFLVGNYAQNSIMKMRIINSGILQNYPLGSVGLGDLMADGNDREKILETWYDVTFLDFCIDGDAIFRVTLEKPANVVPVEPSNEMENEEDLEKKTSSSTADSGIDKSFSD